ncbi:CoA-binding protein [Lutibacter sp.]|uniref:CoA-binding protein n=1 Tax=Lutibacter sp. TaxID=1925666 RepID=UPI001A2633E5|nr:CoA-binding protein [Lutibacter sp.]MBI9040691.1 CoA-binding protein [Lutibacter sp.]
MKKTLVLGASENPDRYSNIAIKRLLNKGIDVVAIGIKTGEVDGVKMEIIKKKFVDIDTVTLYLSAKNQVEYYNYILSLKPNRVLFNPGTENSDFEALLTKNGISFERACTLVLLSLGKY